MFKLRKSRSNGHKHHAAEAEPAAANWHRSERCPNLNVYTGLGSLALILSEPATSERIRKEFHVQLIELADQFDSHDHQHSPDGRGTELQDDCQAVRQLARELAAQQNNGSEA